MKPSVDGSGTPSDKLSVGWLARGLILLCASASSTPAQVVAPQNRRPCDAAVEQGIRRLIASLPSASRLRDALESGARGDGAHYSWMDKMRKEGIKRTLVQTQFVWRGKPTEVKVSRIVYFSKYDHDCAQISDQERLSEIRGSGLEDELGKAAVQRTLEAHWLLINKRHRTKHGVGIIELLDDECLPRAPDILAPAPKTPSPFREAVDMDDVADATVLLHAGVSPEERDGALWASLVENDPCMTTALLRAGADVDLRDKYGFTLLMAAVRYKAFANVQALLVAGANVNAKASNGETALSIARRARDQSMIQLLKDAGARE